MITGACFCKAVTYQVLAESMMQGLCYCADCQTVGGSAYWASYAVHPDSFSPNHGCAEKNIRRSLQRAEKLSVIFVVTAARRSRCSLMTFRSRPSML